MTTHHNGTKIPSMDTITRAATRTAIDAGTVARRNWLPLGLIGAGLAWITTRAILDGRTQARHTHAEDATLAGDTLGILEEAEAIGDPKRDSETIDAKDEGREDAQRPPGQTSYVERFEGRVKDQMDKASRVARRAKDEGVHQGEEIVARAKQTGARMQDGLSRDLKERPLLYVGLGVVAGTALGLALPPSRAERRIIGSRIKATRKQAEQKIHDELERVQRSVSPPSPEERDDATRARQDQGGLH
ncbi:MAG: hypothetical protein K9H25_02595 [Rhodospirillum sp.]|nr:hypothetical protein [Rhodospirillum sp.]MCF8488544.1 hypothetical protein [Rhodospirillum sp.]MCF8499140.1 hypothetical protein [Rhodospirillum sp.]